MERPPVCDEVDALEDEKRGQGPKQAKQTSGEHPLPARPHQSCEHSSSKRKVESCHANHCDVAHDSSPWCRVGRDEIVGGLANGELFPRSEIPVGIELAVEGDA